MAANPLTITVATFSHTGRRRANQDAVEVRRLSSGAELIAVADGMGGHAAGEIASATALEVLVAELESGASLAAAVAAANDAVFSRARERKEWEGMGTTLVALLKDDNGYQISNVGDSRAYRIWADSIEQITSDHSFTAEAVQRGAMTAAQAEASPWKNALTRAVGTDAKVEVDVFGPFALTPPHAVLLCSDGLYRAVADEAIREYVLSTGDVGTASEALAALAYRRGSDDNISLAVIEFETLTRRSPSVTLPLPIQLQRASSVARPKAESNGSNPQNPHARAGHPRAFEVPPRRAAGRSARRPLLWVRRRWLAALAVLAGLLIAAWSLFSGGA
jgi:PPM family protein phosphatase